MRRSRRRQLAAIAALLSVAFAVVVVGTAAAERDQPAAHANSLWLAKQLQPDGTLPYPPDALPDHGLMIDTLFAMYASGDRQLAEPIVEFLDDGGHATDYFTWGGFMKDPQYEAIVIGSQLAKTLIAAEVSGRNPRDFDHYDLVAETKAAIMRSGPDKGLVSTYTKNPEYEGYFDNKVDVFDQALAVIGLAGVGEVDQPALDKLLTQQCSEGYFRMMFELIDTTEVGEHVTPTGQKISTCEEGKPLGMSPTDGDGTAMGLSAMLAARKAGAQGLDEPIARAVGWLKADQKPGGGWGGGKNTEAPNTNSTGLIVQALAEVGGAEAEVAKGQGFIKAAQVKPADANTAIGTEIGAIHYTPDDYEKAKTQGRGPLDTWVRAGAQASLGLSEVGFYDLVKGNIPTPPTTSTGPPTTGPTTTTPLTTFPASRPTPDIHTQPHLPPVTPKAAQQQQASKQLPRPKPRRATGATSAFVPSTTATAASPPPATSPQQPGPTLSPTGRLGEFLANRLVGGDHVEVTANGQTFVDYDATADLVLALRVLDEQSVVADRVSRFLLRQESLKAYAYGAPYENDSAVYAEPLAKLRLVAGFANRGDDAADEFAATIDQLRTDLLSTRTEDGKFVDRGEFADSDNTVRRHAWAVLATAADDQQSTASLNVLIERQCTDGTFPVNLKSEGCGSGDLIATAAAVEALNGRKRGGAPSDGVPGEWSSDRTNALVRAVDALTAQSGEITDVAVGSAVAGARNAVGIEVHDTSEGLRAKLLADGGLPKPGADQSDLIASVGSAQGVAGRSWLNATGSPVTPAARLPANEVPATSQAVAAATATRMPGWAVGSLIGLGVLLVAAAGYTTHRYTNRKAPNEGTSN